MSGLINRAAPIPILIGQELAAAQHQDLIMLKFWALDDGYLEINQRGLFGESVEDIKFRIPIHCFLVKTEDQLILIDTGCGTYFGPTAGRLGKSLKKTGHSPDQVTLIFCTHLHPDHIGGLSLFPNATLCVSEREVKYWINPESEVSEYNKKYVPFVREMVASHQGKILLIRPGEEIVPGVTSVEAYGHTPGHTAFLFELNDQKLLIWGDLVHKADLQFPHPGRLVVIDDNPEAAAIARMRLLGVAADEKLLVGGAHLPDPGLFQVSRLGGIFELLN